MFGWSNYGEVLCGDVGIVIQSQFASTLITDTGFDAPIPLVGNLDWLRFIFPSYETEFLFLFS